MNESIQSDSEYRSVLVEEPFSLDCPHCKAPLLEVGQDYFKCIGQKYWIRDGDTLSVDPCPSIKEKSWDADFEEGSCYSCGKTYLCLGFKMILTKVDDEFEYRYFYENEDRGAFINYFISTAQQKWVTSRFETEKGVMLDSIFGPYPMSGSLFKDQISACRARFNMENEIDLLMLAGRYLFIDPASIKSEGNEQKIRCI